MKIAIIGLGKMGLNIACNLKSHNYDVMGFDLSDKAKEDAEKAGIKTFDNLEKMITSFTEKRVIWSMLPAGEITESVLNQLLKLLSPNDIVIEGGNSNFNESIRRAKTFKEKEVYYFDCGTSGGTSGALGGACTMIGGDPEVFKYIEPIFKDISVENGYLYTGQSGSGHFLKMIHNGIEYGMMQAIGEGFQIVKESEFDYDLADVARVWNNGSVIRGWLMEIAESQFKASLNLEDYRGVVAASGEAKWTIETALDMGIAVPTIALSLFMRNLSQEDDSFSAKVVSALRNGFGGHAVVKKEK
ncbi:phosphogluconate dehydrogenase (NAD(+)-dependent, decarboxylating) [Clostridium sp. 'White wine YQ']|uniref:phosphogluconate dehydrogenase (NAD(+)-dependent, decarboxylating) n=1 Tax=Clostridium sp. 'White wine YQ' TaxID=3027474 RepID=UPI002365864F|nr:decarboxylating 6-phosphogluconate dehydrogenase [Clostridium sp. 'White wine YQ']MDD7794854.1 decarboxylating 6-phosphogluconate dehydrogenase [Clostridium sp. 'White wine YQ']